MNLVEPAADPKRLRSATQLLSRTMDVMIEANETLQLQTLRPGDVLINVEMGDITTADFERVPETIPLGEAATRAMSGALARFAVPEAQYLAWRDSVTTSQRIEARLAGVRFEGPEARQSGVPGAPRSREGGRRRRYRSDQQEAQRMSALQDFDSVGYRLDGDPRVADAHVAAAREELGAGLPEGWTSGYASPDGDLRFALYGRHVRTWMNSLGAQWRNEVQVGGRH